MIKQWEGKQNCCYVQDFVQIDSLKAFYCSDSAGILQTEYEAFISSKQDALSTQLIAIENRILHTQYKIDSTESELMRKAIKHKLYELGIEKRNHLQIIKMYSEAESPTQIKAYEKQMAKYLNTPTNLIGYTVSVVFFGQHGELPLQEYKRTYLLHKDRKEIVCEMN